MKKAVAESRTSYIAMLAEVTVLPFCLAQLTVWPKVKSLHVLHVTTNQLAVFCGRSFTELIIRLTSTIAYELFLLDQQFTVIETISLLQTSL